MLDDDELLLDDTMLVFGLGHDWLLLYDCSDLIGLLLYDCSDLIGDHNSLGLKMGGLAYSASSSRVGWANLLYLLWFVG